VYLCGLLYDSLRERSIREEVNNRTGKSREEVKNKTGKRVRRDINIRNI
jgi:tetrahydromethanopterin S-methyltransferase subunit G